MGCGCSAPVTAPDAREENQNLENSLMDADEVCPTPRNLDDDMHATTDTPTVAADEDEEVVGDDHDAYTPEVDEEELYAQAAVMDDEHDHDEAPHGDGCTPSPRGGACAGEDICWGGTCESFIISPTADDRRAGGGTADGDDDDDGHPLKRRGGKGVDGDDDDMHEVLRDASESVVLVGHGPPGEDEEDVDDHGDASSTRGGAGGVGGQRSAGMDAAELPRIRSGSTWSSRSSPQLSRSFTPTPTATPTSHDATTRGLTNVDGRGVHGASGAHEDDVGGDGCARSASGSGGNGAAPSKRWTLADQLIFDAMRSLSVNGRKVVPRYTTNDDDDDDVVVRDGARDATSSSSPRLPPIISAHPPTHDARRGCARRRVHPTSILTTQAAQNIDACADPRWLRWCISVAEEYAPVMAMPREWMRQHGAAARAHIALLEELRADPDNTWSTSSPTPLRTAKERARQPHTRNPNRCLHASDIVCYPHIEMANTRGLDFKYAEKLRKHACPRCDATCSDWVKRYFPTPPTAEMVEHEAYVFDAQLEKELCQEHLRRVCTPYNHSVVALEQLGSNPSP